MSGNPKKVNLVDLALGLVFLALLAAVAVQLFVPNLLRQAVIDEAERPFVTIVLQSEASFLMEKMAPGDRQTGADEAAQAELQSVEKRPDGKLRAVWRVRAREWRGWQQFGIFTLAPGEQVRIYTPDYVFTGIIVEIRE